MGMRKVQSFMMLADTRETDSISKTTMFDGLQNSCMRDGHRSLTHMVKSEIDVPSIFSLHHVLESDQVIMSCKSLQVHDFSESPLSISGVSEGIKALLQRQHLASALLDGLPDDTVGLQGTRGSLNKKLISRSFLHEAMKNVW